ncbi:MAG: hypothetical protein F4211_02180 [Acidimicrobiia bacterium]|nr:hypothetical protein [Acidimicrobiia bacterium]
MTAEIAILNRYGVAVAADSAVTLTSDAKVYNTANKILPLSIDPPIVVMFYGASSLGPIPWETIVQEYKRLNQSIQFSTVEEHGSHFIDFLSQMTRHISSEIQTNFVRNEILHELEQLSYLARSSLGTYIRSHPGTRSEKLNYFLHQLQEVVRSRIEYLAEIGPVSGLDEGKAFRQLDLALQNWELFDKKIDDWDDLLDIWFSQRPELLMQGEGILNRAIRQDIGRMTIQNLRTAHWSTGSTGMVVTGFGKDQIFPSLAHWIIDQMMDDVVKTRQLEMIEINDAKSSAILPFAQQHEISKTLIDGIHPKILEVHYKQIGKMLKAQAKIISERIKNRTPDSISTPLMKDLQGLSEVVLRNAHDEMEAMIRQYSLPLVELVAGLPKEHLGEMAETLVSLASFKEKFTPGAESIGGPIDVAVISRGEGLVWFKHK